MPNGTPESDPPFMSQEADWEALARYVSGESSPEEVQRLEARFASQPADKALVDALAAVTSRMVSDIPRDLDVEEALQRVKARRNTADIRPLSAALPGDAQRQVRWHVPFTAIAAALIFAVGVAGFLTLRDRPAQQASSPVRRMTATGVGAFDSLRLSDGTRVVLGPLSSIIIAESYGERAREVEVRGDAYFDVVHDSSKPFVVHASAATIQDLGTTFAVRTDASQGVVVAVSVGSVSLRAANSAERNAVILKAGESGLLAPNGQTVTRHETADEMAWLHGRLVFREAPLPEVVASVRRWYGIQLRVADSSLASRHLTATFSGEPPDRVLQVIGLALGGEVERHGDTAIVRATKPSARLK